MVVQAAVLVNEPSKAYRAGQFAGAWFRYLTFTVGISGLALGLIAGFGPRSWRTPVAIVAMVIGALLVSTLIAATRSISLACFGFYFVLVGAGSIFQSHKPQPTWALIAIAAGTIVSSVAGTLSAFLGGRRSKEVDRLMFTESITIAFFVTMLFALSYGLLEAWFKAPKLSMWLVFTVGMVSWVVSSLVFRRRYS